MEIRHLLVIFVTTFYFSLQVETVQLLSHQKPTNQSSTYYSQSLKFSSSASLAVDGNINQRWVDKSCSCTQKSIDPWWSVDLVGLARVTNVKVYSIEVEYGAKLDGFKVFLSNDSLNEILCADGPQSVAYGQIINLKCENDDETARIVRITLNADSRRYLILCEMKVYGYWTDEILSKFLDVQQSTTGSTYSMYGRNEDFYASYAVDGNKNTKSATLETSNSWWQAILSERYRVTRLSVYSKSNSFKVSVANSTGTFKQCSRVPQSIHFICKAIAKIIRIQQLNDEILILKEVQIYGQRIGTVGTVKLLSKGMEAEQSSTPETTLSYGFSYSASLAVDGKSPVLALKSGSSMTTLSTNPWWQVKLASVSRISAVSVFSEFIHTDKLSGFKVLVANSTTTDNFIQCASAPQKLERFTHLECNAVGKIVRIQLFGADRVLALCEVKVYGREIRD